MRIQNTWQQKTLGTIIDLIGGGTPKTTIPEYWNGTIPWLSVVDFNNDSRWVSKTEKNITEAGLKNSSTKLLQKDDIIISARGTVGEIAQLTKPMAFNQSCYGIRGKKDIIDQNYLYYLLKINVTNFLKNAHGAVFSTITRETFNNIHITLPPLPEQRAIAAVLSGFDDKIKHLRSQNQTLEKIAQTLFHEWFIDFNFPNEEGKPYKKSGGKMVESEMGMIPVEWRVGKLFEIAEISAGKRPQDISANKTKTHAVKLIGASKTMGYVQQYLYSGDTLITGRVGTHGIVQRFNDNIWPSDNTLVIKSENFNFTYNILKDIDYEKLNRGAVQPLITQNDLKNHTLVIPSHPILNYYKEITGTLFHKFNHNKLENHTLTEIRDKFLTKLLAGSIRIQNCANTHEQ